MTNKQASSALANAINSLKALKEAEKNSSHLISDETGQFPTIPSESFQNFKAGIDPINDSSLVIFGTAGEKITKDSWLGSFNKDGVVFFDDFGKEELPELNFNLVEEILALEQFKK